MSCECRDDLLDGMLAFALAFDLLVQAGTNNLAAGRIETSESDVHLGFYRAVSQTATIEDEHGTVVYASRRSTRFGTFVHQAKAASLALVVRDKTGRPMRWYL